LADLARHPVRNLQSGRQPFQGWQNFSTHFPVERVGPLPDPIPTFESVHLSLNPLIRLLDLSGLTTENLRDLRKRIVVRSD
jgi:hypothetical protein